jgi:uncharacterized protein YraI
MPHLNGVVTAGIAEATRVAHTVIHRGAEAGIAVIVGEKVDQARADRIPEAGAGARVGRRQRRERDPRDRRGRDEHEREPADEPTTGSLIDLQA